MHRPARGGVDEPVPDVDGGGWRRAHLCVIEQTLRVAISPWLLRPMPTPPHPPPGQPQATTLPRLRRRLELALVALGLLLALAAIFRVYPRWSVRVDGPSAGPDCLNRDRTH